MKLILSYRMISAFIIFSLVFDPLTMAEDGQSDFTLVPTGPAIAGKSANQSQSNSVSSHQEINSPYPTGWDWTSTLEPVGQNSNENNSRSIPDLPVGYPTFPTTSVTAPIVDPTDIIPPPAVSATSVSTTQIIIEPPTFTKPTDVTKNPTSTGTTQTTSTGVTATNPSSNTTAPSGGGTIPTSTNGTTVPSPSGGGTIPTSTNGTTAPSIGGVTTPSTMTFPTATSVTSNPSLPTGTVTSGVSTASTTTNPTASAPSSTTNPTIPNPTTTGATMPTGVLPPPAQIKPLVTLASGINAINGDLVDIHLGANKKPLYAFAQSVGIHSVSRRVVVTDEKGVIVNTIIGNGTVLSINGLQVRINPTSIETIRSAGEYVLVLFGAETSNLSTGKASFQYIALVYNAKTGQIELARNVGEVPQGVSLPEGGKLGLDAAITKDSSGQYSVAVLKRTYSLGSDGKYSLTIPSLVVYTKSDAKEYVQELYGPYYAQEAGKNNFPLFTKVDYRVVDGQNRLYVYGARNDAYSGGNNLARTIPNNFNLTVATFSYVGANLIPVAHTKTKLEYFNSICSPSNSVCKSDEHRRFVLEAPKGEMAPSVISIQTLRGASQQVTLSSNGTAVLSDTSYLSIDHRLFGSNYQYQTARINSAFTTITRIFNDRVISQGFTVVSKISFDGSTSNPGKTSWSIFGDKNNLLVTISDADRVWSQLGVPGKKRILYGMTFDDSNGVLLSVGVLNPNGQYVDYVVSLSAQRFLEILFNQDLPSPTDTGIGVTTSVVTTSATATGHTQPTGVSSPTSTSPSQATGSGVTLTGNFSTSGNTTAIVFAATGNSGASNGAGTTYPGTVTGNAVIEPSSPATVAPDPTKGGGTTQIITTGTSPSANPVTNSTSMTMTGSPVTMPVSPVMPNNPTINPGQSQNRSVVGTVVKSPYKNVFAITLRGSDVMFYFQLPEGIVPDFVSGDTLRIDYDIFQYFQMENGVLVYLNARATVVKP